MNIWADGFCKKCGHLVIETQNCTCEDGDYMNTCTNPECSEFRWHACSDDEELGYYWHRRPCCST